jgi:hypothetical protein
MEDGSGSDSDSDSEGRESKRIKSSDKTETHAPTNDSKPSTKDGGESAGGVSPSAGGRPSAIDQVLEDQSCEMPSIFESDGGD